VWSLLLNILRVVLQDWPKPRPWDYIWTVIFLGVGLGAITDFQISGGTIAGVVLVAIGVISLARIFSSSN
jgi:hypothetical protein